MAEQTRQHSMAWRSFLLPAIVIGATLSACSWIPKGESELDIGIKDRGVASWYGEQFHGRLAANGEVFDMSALTAAHRTLPLGSMVRVVNLQNGRHVRVRINDRGPYVNGRILDLSYAAAAQLGMVEGGVSVVQIQVIGDHRPDFIVASEETSLSSPPLLTVHRIDGQAMPASAIPALAYPDPAMACVHRVLPNDVLLQRRVRRVPSILAADHTAHMEVAALVLD
jgi:rare lipoprotein A